MRIDLVWYKDVVRRYLVITSKRLRSLLGMPRHTELPPVQKPASLEEMIIEARKELSRVSTNAPRRRETTRLDTVVQPATAVPSRTATPRAEREPVEVTGILVSGGMRERPLHGQTINQYGIDIKVDALNGQVQQFYGADIDRAIRDARAVPGDRITLKQCGAVPCIVPFEDKDADGNTKRSTKRSFKNTFVVTKHNSTMGEQRHA